MSSVITLLIAIAAVGQAEASAKPARPVTEFQTGARFLTEIDRTLSASWAKSAGAW